MDDYHAVREGCKHCTTSAPRSRNHSGQVKYGEQSISDTIVQRMTASMADDL